MKLHLIEATGEMKECRAGSPSTCPKVQHLSEEDRQIFHFDSNDRDSIKSAEARLRDRRNWSTIDSPLTRRDDRFEIYKNEDGSATLTSVHRVSGREYPTWSVKLRNAPDKVRDTDFDYLREVHGMLHQLELPEGAEMGKGLRLTYTCDCPGRHHAQSVAEDRCPKYRTQLRIPVSKEGRRYTINQESVVGYSSSDPGVLSLNNHEMRVLKESIESSWPDRERIFNDFAVKSNSQIASVESDTIGLRSNEL